MWFSDYQTENVCLDIRIEKELYSGQSEYQRIEILQSESFGRILVLDGSIVFSEADEFIYNEMVTHVPMSVHPDVKKVLIIGGGDGGVCTEFTAYPEIEEIDVVEPDEELVEVCMKYFPDTARGFNDERVHIYHQDGLRFLRG